MTTNGLWNNITDSMRRLADDGDRMDDLHFTRAEKLTARKGYQET